MSLASEEDALRKEVRTMSFQEGEVYRCPDEACGCELAVTKGDPPSCDGQPSPTCCCGKTMAMVKAV